MVRVIPVEAHDDGDFGRKAIDGAIALVDFGHDPVAGTDAPGRHGRIVKQAAEEPAAGNAGPAQRGDEHAGGGGLAVRADHGDQPPVAEDFSQQLAPAHHRQAARGGVHPGRVTRRDGG